MATGSVSDPTSWRAGLRKTGSTSAVPETSVTSASSDRKLHLSAVQKSASSSGVISSNVSGLLFQMGVASTLPVLTTFEIKDAD